MQVVVFGAHEAPRERLALSYTSRRDHLGAECLPLHPRWQRASGERALQGASSGTALGNVCFTLRSRTSHHFHFYVRFVLCMRASRTNRRIAEERPPCRRILSISETVCDSVAPRAFAISFRPLQNASSRLTPVLCPSMVMERRTIADFMSGSPPNVS